MIYSTWKSNLKHTPIKSFLEIVVFLFLVILLPTYETYSASVEIKILSYSNLPYIPSKSDSSYTIVLIRDTTTSGIPIQQAALYQQKKCLLPFYYDTIYSIAPHIFVVRQHLVERRSYSLGEGIYDGLMHQFLLPCKSQRIQRLSSTILSIQRTSSTTYYSLISRNKVQTKNVTVKWDSTFLLLLQTTTIRVYDQETLSPVLSDSIVNYYQSKYQPTATGYWQLHTGASPSWSIQADSVLYSRTENCWYYYINHEPHAVRSLILSPKEHASFTTITPTATIDTLFRNRFRRIQKVDSTLLQVNGFFLIQKNKLYGYCDSLGNMVIAPQYDTLGLLSEGLCAVRFPKGWGFLNTQEILQIQPYYDKVETFNQTVSIVQQQQQFLFLDRFGKNKNSITYDSIRLTPLGNYYVYKKGKVGLCNAYGEEQISTKFTLLKEVRDQLYVFSKEDTMFGLLDKNQTVLVAPSYSQFIIEPITQAVCLRSDPSY
ncbi:MAG: WG repeat-containing protein [Cytophagaceae bacterium]|jgi:hypothetical protein|nr:WG repeat-containing protein [Cytophagaceae bacterium]